MKSTGACYFKTTSSPWLRSPILWLPILLVLPYLVRSSAEPPTATDHIVSPHTKETLQFFSMSGSSSIPNKLAVVKIETQTHILKKQTQLCRIILPNYTLESVPQRLVEGIEFTMLLIESGGGQSTIIQLNPAVMSKILRAFGTICAETLELCNLKTNASDATNQEMLLANHSSSELDTHINPTQCILNLKKLIIAYASEPTIQWWQERVDMSQSWIELEIWGGHKLHNLAVLDGFNAGGIVALELYSFLKLDSLECKLLREGPLPKVLSLLGPNTMAPVLSEQIVHNICSNHWSILQMSKELWENLMKSDGQSKYITTDSLALYVSHMAIMSSSGVSTFLSMENNQATVNSLMIKFNNIYDILSPLILTRALQWIGRHFRGLTGIDISTECIRCSGRRGRGHCRYCAPPTLIEFVTNNMFEITTNPTLKNIRITNYDRIHSPKKKETILCFSFDAWRAYREGKLAEELTQSGADLSELGSNEQEILMTQRWVSGAYESLCVICLDTVDELCLTNPNTEICILDHPEHIICGGCFDRLCSRMGVETINCPVCRGKIARLPLRNKIERNNQGVFKLTMAGPIPPRMPVLSFPSTGFLGVLTHYQE
ncbi:hypothetical protein NEDG_02038 [Nematocida displodere]|uniref:RING-type domain-containing protein n=1 Tax=Nematocida displodere TaxID=1805483 RepID=A0A177EK13_9MICR|nr:hypothetical protein NEDG_02038 [Nematocida displodere]